MPEEINKGSGWKQAIQNPATYYMLVAISVMWVFVHRFIGSSDQVNINCEAEKVQLRKDLTVAQTKLDQLTTALLIKNGIIYKQEQDKQELDSALREGPGKKAKKIIKEK